MNFIRRISTILVVLLISTQAFSIENEKKQNINPYSKYDQKDAYSFNIEIYNIESKNKFENISKENVLSKIEKWSSEKDYVIKEENYIFNNLYFVDNKEIVIMTSNVLNNKAISFEMKNDYLKEIIALNIEYMSEIHTYKMAIGIKEKQTLFIMKSNEENKNMMTVIVITLNKK